MRKLLACTMLAGVALLLNACYSAPVRPPVGMIFSDISAPISVDFEKAKVGHKTGTATAESVLGLVSWGDASTNAAAKAGGIQTTEYTDYHFYNVLGVYMKFETKVIGE
jgi:hypothetical protein